MDLALSFGGFGTNDFIEYWTAFQLFTAQSNPYDPAALLKLQQAIGWSDATPLMMWNPPWLLLVMAPVLVFGFPQAAVIWLMINLGLLGWLVYMTVDVLFSGGITLRRMLYGVVAAATFFPMWTSLKVGQLGVFLSWAFCGAIWAIERKRPVMAGICLSLWSLKVHLFLPVAVYLVFRSMKDPFLWRCFAYSALFLSIFIIATELYHPAAITEWLGAFEGAKKFNQLPHIQGSSVQVVLVEQWIAASLTGAVRMFLAEDGLTPAWPMWVVPLIGVFIVGVAAIRTPKDSTYLQGLCLASLVAVAFAPFGWVFDFSILLPVYILTLLGLDWRGLIRPHPASLCEVDSEIEHGSVESTKTLIFKGLKLPIDKMLVSLFLLNQATAWGLSMHFNEHQQYLWIPLIMLAGVASRGLVGGRY